MAPSASIDDGGRNVAGEYLVAEPLDYFHFAEAPDWVYGLVLQPDPEARPAASVREIDVAHPSKRKGRCFELEMVKVLQGYAIEAMKIPLSGSVAGFAGDIGAVLTRQDILTNLQCGPSRRGRTGSTRGDR
jgi:hypothetical protein